MSKGGECRWLQIEKSTVVITILWTPGAWSNWPPSSQFQSTETQGFRGKAEAQNSRSKLIAILNDTFPNFLLTLALPSLCWAALQSPVSVWLRMLNVIFIRSHCLEQITLTMSALTLHFQWSIKSIFIKKPFYIKVLVCFSLCLFTIGTTALLFSFDIYGISYKKLLLKLKLDWFCHITSILWSKAVLILSQLVSFPCGFRFGGKGRLDVASWPHTPLLHKREN